MAKQRWKWSFTRDFRVSFVAYEAPPPFYRFMQRIILGIHWKEVK